MYMRNSKYKIGEIKIAVETSFSWAEVCRKVGATPATGTQSHIKKRCVAEKIDFSHFTGKLWNKGKILPSKRPIDDYLSGKFFINSHSLKLRLWKEGLKPKLCEVCTFSKWMGKEIPLELDHKDNNHENNSLENLMIMCPTCHAQKTREERKHTPVVQR